MTTAIQDKIGATVTPRRGRSVPVETTEDDVSGGFWLRLSGRWQKAKSMDNLWDISGEWWDQRPVIKMYFRVTTEDQSQLIVFRDLLEGTWYREGYGEEETDESAGHPAAVNNRQAAQKNCKYQL